MSKPLTTCMVSALILARAICITYHWKIFRAKARTATLTVSDWQSPNRPDPPFGQEQAFNFLEIQPYHE